MRILGIESSCDETAVAIVENGQTILSNVVVSQIDIFAAYGGVIPEIAARSHLEAILPAIHQAFQEANLKTNSNQDDWSKIEAFLVLFSLGHSPLAPSPSYNTNHSMQFTTLNHTSMLTGFRTKLSPIFLSLP